MAESKIHTSHCSEDCLVDYVSEVTHLRIYHEDQGDEWPWHLDAADETNHYSEDVRRFSTFAEALACIPEFIADNASLTWKWRGQNEFRI